MGYFNKEEVSSKLREYTITKSIELRNEIVLMCLSLVNYIVRQYIDMDKTLKTNELKSYGYEGLITAIETYKENSGSFINYFCVCIRNKIRNGIEEIKGYPQTYYWDFLNSRRPIERETDEYLEFDSSRFDYLIDEIQKRGYLNSERCQKLCNIFEANNGISLDDAEYISSKEDIASEIELREDIQKALNCLSERDKQIIMLRYGFINNRTYSLNEIGEFLGITHEGIRYREKQAHKKLKKELGKDYLK